MKREALIAARNSEGLSQEALARKCGISQDVYYRIEVGRQKRVDVVLADKLAKALGKTINDIFLPTNTTKLRRKQSRNDTKGA
jgi:DNA-binding XRE family transcriptional regulator